jgi:hypothetical protein
MNDITRIMTVAGADDTLAVADLLAVGYDEVL